MTKRITNRLEQTDELRVEIFQRSSEELRSFMERHDFDFQEAAKILGIGWTSFRNFIYVTDKPRIPRMHTFLRWQRMDWPLSIKKNKNGTVIDFNYIFSGSRETPENKEIQALRNRIDDLESKLRRESYKEKFGTK